MTFGTIYNFLVDRKVLLKKVSDLESVTDRRAELLCICNPGKGDTCIFHNDRTLGIPVEYTRTLEKPYRCFKVMPKQNGHICIVPKVLPSMKKDRVHNVIIIICKSTTKVSTANCACPCRVLQSHNSYIILS